MRRWICESKKDRYSQTIYKIAIFVLLKKKKESEREEKRKHNKLWEIMFTCFGRQFHIFTLLVVKLFKTKIIASRITATICVNNICIE